MSKKLTDGFLDEVLKLCFSNKAILDICIRHLEYHFIPIEAYKKIWKSVRSRYINTGLIPSIGVVSQELSDGSDIGDTIAEILSGIKRMTLPNEKEVIDQLNMYVKDAISLDFWDRFVDEYKGGDTEKARSIMIETGEKLSKFTILDGGGYYKRVFDQFTDRNDRRFIDFVSRNYVEDKIPFSINEIDTQIGGGMDRKETACFLMRSGAGKTKALRHIGVGAARRGYKVLHIQGEGSIEECLEGYDATWTGSLLRDVRTGSIDDDKFDDINKVIDALKVNGGEILVHGYKSFDEPNMFDVRRLISDVINIEGSLDLVLIDYLELFDPSDGKVYSVGEERHRRRAISRKMKNITNEFDVRLITATQASDVNQEKIANPRYVMRRSQISEAKGLIDAFSYFFTGNQTTEEYDNGIMRILCEKLRNYKSEITVKICQDYAHNRFYDKIRTSQLPENQVND